jgi:RimJ/RimL family protein N-acetyltransferase
MPVLPSVVLRPFTSALLQVVQPWSHSWVAFDEPGPAMGLAYVVNPRQWRRGFGTATLLAAMAAPEVAEVILFAAGIETDDTASGRCAMAAGLVPDTSAPDWEGIVHHVRRRELGGRRRSGVVVASA